MVKNINEISIYFPSFEEGSLSDREYLWNVMFSIKTEATTEIIQTARSKRSVTSTSSDENLVEIHPDLLEKLKQLKPQKSNDDLF